MAGGDGVGTRARQARVLLDGKRRDAIDRWFHHHLIFVLILILPPYPFSARAHHLGSQHTDRQTVCLSAVVSVCLSVCLSACLSIYLSVCLSVCSSHLLQQDHKPLRPADVRTARKGTLRRGRWLSRRDRADCKKEELEVPMGTARCVPSTSTCCAPFWTRAHVL